MWKIVGELTINRDNKEKLAEIFRLSEDFDLIFDNNNYSETTYKIITPKRSYGINGNLVDDDC